MFSLAFVVASLFAALASSAAVPRSLPSGTVTCGKNKYAVSAISAAINAGVKDMNAGNFPGEHCDGLIC